MSFEALKKVVGQQSVIVIDLYLDQDDPAIESWTDPKSYNTPKTTTLPGAYNPETPKKLYRFSNQQLGPAAGVHFPILRSQSLTPPVLKDGIALFAGLTFSLADIITNDVYELPEEFADRRITGSFIAKLFARNYFHNRVVIFRQGFDPLNFDLANFQSQTFIVDKVQGPSYNGIATFSCLDPLVWTEESKAKAPLKSNGELLADIDNVQTTLQLNGTVNPGEYGATGYIFIDSEVLGYTVTSDVPPLVDMTVTRAEWGTTADEHSAGALGQDCFFAIDENVTDIILRLFDLTNITPDLINLAQFTDAKNTSLELHNYTGIVTKPTAVNEIIKDLLTLAQSQIFYDTVEGLVSFIHIDEFESPSFTIDALLDILPDTLTTKYAEDAQVTRQAIDWARLDASNDDIENYSKGYIFADDIKEAAGIYGEKSEGETIVTNWLDDSPEAVSLATGITQRIVEKKSTMPVNVSFQVDLQFISSISDGFWLGDFISIVNAPLLTGPDLLPVALNIQVTSFKPQANDIYNISGIAYTQIPQGDIDYVIEDDFEDLLLTDIAPPIAGRVTVVFIASSATIGATTTANAALTTGLYPDGLLIRNRGRIWGMGGNGGGYQVQTLPTIGGNALEVQAVTTIDNGGGGLIWAGGGGGGRSDSILIPPGTTFGGSGGGGGQGYAISLGGLGQIPTGNPGGDGENGDQDGPGQGGDKYIFPPTGGDGGEFGLPGQNAQLGQAGALPGESIIETGAGDVIEIIAGNNEFQLKPIPPLI